MWTFQNAGRASEVLAALQAIDPADLPNALARLVRSNAIDIVSAMPANAGLLASLRSDPTVGISIGFQRLAFGSYAN